MRIRQSNDGSWRYTPERRGDLSFEARQLADLKLWLADARQRFKQHGYEADARECERLLLEIRALDPGFEEAR